MVSCCNTSEGVDNFGPGLYDFSVSFVDVNADGWADLLLGGDFFTSRLLINMRNRTFADDIKFTGFTVPGVVMAYVL